MAYTLGFDLNLSITGLTLEAQLTNTAGVDQGAPITTGFVEMGNGFYYFDGASAFPDDFRGGIKFQDSGGGTLRTFKSVNPEEAENLDAKVSTIWDEVLEGTFTARQLMRIIGAASAGEASGLAGATAQYKAVSDNAKNRITMTTDGAGNRSGAIYDLS